MPCIDGEGKPVIKESPYSDEQGLSQMESISLRSMLMVSGLVWASPASKVQMLTS